MFKQKVQAVKQKHGVEWYSLFENEWSEPLHWSKYLWECVRVCSISESRDIPTCSLKERVSIDRRLGTCFQTALPGGLHNRARPGSTVAEYARERGLNTHNQHLSTTRDIPGQT
jgi:hypothetical protein